MTSGSGARFHTTVPAAQIAGGARYFLEAEDSAGRRSVWPPAGFVAVQVGSDREPPAVRHNAVTSAPVGKPLRIDARVDDASGVRGVRLRYRAVNQHQDFRSLPMLATGQPAEYRAEIPAAHIDPKFDLMYFQKGVSKGCQKGVDNIPGSRISYSSLLI